MAKVHARREKTLSRLMEEGMKAFKNGLSEEDKNLLKAAGVLVGAIVAVNVTNAIVGGRSSAPFA